MARKSNEIASPANRSQTRIITPAASQLVGLPCFISIAGCAVAIPASRRPKGLGRTVEDLLLVGDGRQYEFECQAFEVVAEGKDKSDAETFTTAWAEDRAISLGALVAPAVGV